MAQFRKGLGADMPGARFTAANSELQLAFLMKQFKGNMVGVCTIVCNMILQLYIQFHDIIPLRRSFFAIDGSDTYGDLSL